MSHETDHRIDDADGQLVGAVGVIGDSPDNDEHCALAGIAAAGLSALIKIGKSVAMPLCILSDPDTVATFEAAFKRISTLGYEVGDDRNAPIW